MKGNERLLETLNSLLADELTAVSQYIVHSEMCGNWGYGKLHDGFEKRAIDEMKHAEALIGRILFLEGTPIVSNLRAMHIGKDVSLQLDNDHGLRSTRSRPTTRRSSSRETWAISRPGRLSRRSSTTRTRTSTGSRRCRIRSGR